MAKTGEKTTRNRRKNGFGKFILTLLILILAAGAVFWFGWVQFRIGENEVAVVYTKTGGYDSEVLRSGEFVWRWEALLPTNLTLHIIKLENQKATISVEGQLPSGDQYARVAGDGVSFAWRLTVEIDYRLNADSLPALMSSGRLTSDTGTVYTGFETGLKSQLGQVLADEVNADTAVAIVDRLGGLEEKIAAMAAVMDERIEVLGVNVTEISYPDPALYQQARRLALELMNSRNAVITEVEIQAIRRGDAQNARIDLLRQYGEVFEKYPILLDLFALEGNPGRSLLPPDNPGE